MRPRERWSRSPVWGCDVNRLRRSERADTKVCGCGSRKRLTDNGCQTFNNDRQDAARRHRVGSIDGGDRRVTGAAAETGEFANGSRSRPAAVRRRQGVTRIPQSTPGMGIPQATLKYRVKPERTRMRGRNGHMMQEIRQQALTVAEAAEALRVSPWLVREACRPG